MNPKRVLSAMLVMSLMLAGSGCTKTERATQAPKVPTTPPSSNTVLRAHWVGKNNLGVAASAFSFTRLLDYPESKQLQAHVLMRLAGAITSPGETNAPSPTSMTLAALLEDAVNRECFLEIRRPPNEGEQFVFAIRLDEARANAWQLSVAGVLSIMRGTYPTTKAEGWTLKDPRSQNTIEFTQTGAWTLVGVAPSQNALLATTVARIQAEGTPNGFAEESAWLEAHVDGKWVAKRLRLSAEESPKMPTLSLTVTGDGANVVTRAKLEFGTPLNLQLEPWELPADQIQNPIVGFTGVRGIRNWLNSTKQWTDLNLGKAPNQIFIWADAALPLQMHLAATSESSGGSSFNAPALAQRVSHWLTNNGLGSLESFDSTGIVWKGLPIFSPFLKAAANGSSTRLIGGTMADSKQVFQVPAPVYPRLTWEELKTEIEKRTNLVAYEWETTGVRAESMFVLSQVMRVARLHPQLPQDARSSAWVQAIRQRLGNTTTTITLTAPDQLTLERKSAIGLTAAELYLLGDWMESPDFPSGLYSTRTRRAASAAEFEGKP